MAGKGRDGRRLGWSLAIVGLLMVAAWIAVRAARTTGDEFNQSVGWANILGAFIGAAGLCLVLFGPRDSSQKSTAETADALMNEILTVEGGALRELLYAGRDRGRTANVTYHPEGLIHYRAVGEGGVAGDLEGVADFYAQHTEGRLVILGAPGAGKTVLALQLLCELAEYRRQLDDSTRARTPVPVRLDLADWDITRNLQDWLVQALTDRYTNVTEKAARGLVDEGLVLAVLDGLDEMDSPGEELTRARIAIGHLNRSVRGTQALSMVVTCREEEYQCIGDEVADATVIVMNPLTDEQIRSYMTNELVTIQDQRALKGWQTLAKASDNEWVFDLLRTPWALTLMVTFLRDGGAATEVAPIPGEMKPAYQNRVWGVLLSRYVPARTRASNEHGYTVEQVERWSTALAHNLGEEVDIRLTDCWRIGGSLKVRAAHVLSIMILILGAFFIMALSAIEETTRILDWWATYFSQILVGNSIEVFAVPPLLSMLFLSILLKTVWVAIHADIPSPQNPMSFALLYTTDFWKRFIAGFILGFMLGFLLGLIFGFVFGLATWDEFGIGTAFGIGTGVWAGATLGFSADINTVTPANTVNSDLYNCLSVGVAGSIIGGLTLGAANGFALGAAAGVAVGLAIGLGQVWWRYICGLISASLHRRGPLQPNRFFRWAVQSGLLRRSGPVYQFRHLSLRNHLQDSDLPSAD